jgi:hypothetical protein
MSEDERESVLYLHLLDGEPQGPRVLGITHTNSQAIAVPRGSYERVSKSRPEIFKLPGVYILVYDPIGVGPLSERIYIGEADVARERMNTHVREADDDWNWFVLFTSRDGKMNKVHAEYIESRLVALAHQAGRAELENKNDPQEPTLDPVDMAIARRFLADVLMYCPLLGIGAFSTPRGLTPTAPSPKPFVSEAATASPIMSVGSPSPVRYHIKTMIEAKGYNSERGFVVLAGSPLRPDVSPSAEQRYGLTKLRDELEARGIISRGDGVRRLAREYVFDSPSQAAVFVLGYPVSGRTTWITDDGRTLNDVESGELPGGGG